MSAQAGQESLPVFCCWGFRNCSLRYKIQGDAEYVEKALTALYRILHAQINEKGGEVAEVTISTHTIYGGGGEEVFIKQEQ
jgi:hypothetical protein